MPVSSRLSSDLRGFASKSYKGGTEGRNRTGTILLSSDFESDAYSNLKQL